MEKIKIDKITKKKNIREDYGDLTELTESIREHGIRQPIELNPNNEIIDGHRRMVAAKAAGLDEIPYFYTDNTVDEKTSQMIAGIFQKNLNPVEEGKAFQQYIDEEKITTEQLAARISKRKNYVEKRIEIAKLPIKVQTMLIKKKLQIGHALLLARMTGDDRLSLMREIISDDMSVGDAKDRTGWNSKNLDSAPFCKQDCKNCIHNGSKQAELFETGTILSGNCLNNKCFNRKIKEFVSQKKEEFADILFERKSEHNGNENPEGYIDASYSWSREQNGITEAYMKKCRKNRENYLVRINRGGDITEYFKKLPKKTESGEVIDESEEVVDKKESALLTKVSEFKTNFLIDRTKDKVVPGTHEAKALGVLRIIQQASYTEKDRASKEIGNLMKDEYGPYPNVKNIFTAEESALNNAIAVLSKDALRGVDLKNLILISRNFGIDVKNDFEITEDYLKMYTKDQLNDLIKEFQFEIVSNLKKSETIEQILQQNLKGKVPRVML